MVANRRAVDMADYSKYKRCSVGVMSLIAVLWGMDLLLTGSDHIRGVHTFGDNIRVFGGLVTIVGTSAFIRNLWPRSKNGK